MSNSLNGLVPTKNMDTNTLLLRLLQRQEFQDYPQLYANSGRALVTSYYNHFVDDVRSMQISDYQIIYHLRTKIPNDHRTILAHFFEDFQLNFTINWDIFQQYIKYIIETTDIPHLIVILNRKVANFEYCYNVKRVTLPLLLDEVDFYKSTYPHTDIEYRDVYYWFYQHYPKASLLPCFQSAPHSTKTFFPKISKTLWGTLLGYFCRSDPPSWILG